MGNEMITFTPEKRDRLRDCYEEAVEKGEDLFVFEGNNYYVKYAAYLLEYLDNRFGTEKPFPVGPHDRSWCG